MRFLSMMGNSFGCSASGERLVSAARDGDFQEAKALLECNPRLGRYSTFGVRNSPLHYSAAQGHHEIVSLLLESGVDINLRNYRGQTALMQACHHGHWEVVLTLILYKANIHKADYLTGGTALHFAAANGHPRCIRLLLADYIPSEAGVWKIIKTLKNTSNVTLEESELSRIINRAADGGITALHMAALNGHVECMQLLLDLGASVSKVTVEDGTTIDLIGAGSTPLHYAACGGNAQCCQVLVSRGASLTAENANGWTPLLVARLWNRHWLEGVLNKQQESRQSPTPSPYLWIPLMSIVKVARECGWRTPDALPTCGDPCSVCLERSCSVSAEGCGHELCTQCALYLCCTNSTPAASSGSPGSVSCPFCRQGIVSFAKLRGTCRIKEAGRPSLSLSLCTTFSGEPAESGPLQSKAYRSDFTCTRISPFSSSSFRSLSCQRFGSMKLNASFCMGASETCPSLVPCSERRGQNQTLQRSASHIENRRSGNW